MTILTLLAHRLPTPIVGLRPRRRPRQAVLHTRAVRRGRVDMQRLLRPCHARLWTRMAHSQILRPQDLVACQVRMRLHLLEMQMGRELVERCSMQIPTPPCGHPSLRVDTPHHRVMNRMLDTDER